MKKSSIQDFSFNISVPETVNQFVSERKKRVQEVIGRTFRDRYFCAHISLHKYTDRNTDSQLYRANEVLQSLMPLDIHVNGFGIFEHGSKRSIYLKIDYESEISDVAKKLGARKLRPHITIASSLELDDYKKAWDDLKDIRYSTYFRCDKVNVLKWEFNRWDRYLKLPLDDK